MILDFICMVKDYDKRLIDDIKMAVSIIDKHKVFTFKYNDPFVPSEVYIYIAPKFLPFISQK